jgi:hypothetical protein
MQQRKTHKAPVTSLRVDDLVLAHLRCSQPAHERRVSTRKTMQQLESLGLHATQDHSNLLQALRFGKLQANCEAAGLSTLQTLPTMQVPTFVATTASRALCWPDPGRMQHHSCCPCRSCRCTSLIAVCADTVQEASAESGTLKGRFAGRPSLSTGCASFAKVYKEAAQSRL